MLSTQIIANLTKESKQLVWVDVIKRFPFHKVTNSLELLLHRNVKYALKVNNSSYIVSPLLCAYTVLHVKIPACTWIWDGSVQTVSWHIIISVAVPWYSEIIVLFGDSCSLQFQRSNVYCMSMLEYYNTLITSYSFASKPILSPLHMAGSTNYHSQQRNE